MAYHMADLANAVIASGGTASGAVGGFSDATSIGIRSPATLTNTTITVEVEETDTGTSFEPLQSGGSDVTMSAGEYTVLTDIPFRQLRVVGATAEAAARTFAVVKKFGVRN